MKILSFLNNKGGVGKTATVTTVAHMLATKYKKKVLVVDMDPQSNTTARFSSLDWGNIFISIYKGEELKSSEGTVEDILLDKNADPHKVILKTAYPNLDMIPARLTLSTCEELLKSDVKSPQQFRLKNQLTKLSEEYDFCLIDCSPSISILNINALTASHEVYLPLRTDGDSCIGLAISLNLVKEVQEYNPELEIGGVIMTQVNWQEGVAKTTYDLLSRILPEEYLIPIQIGNSKYLKENSFEQKPLLEADKGRTKSPVTNAYLLLSEYIMADNKALFVKKNAKRLDALTHLRKGV